MKTGSKLGCDIPLPLGITPSSVFQYIGIHIQYIYNCTSKFQNFANLSHVQLFTLNVQNQAPPLPELLLLVLSSQLILKPRNFAAISLIMFHHWVVPT